MMAEPLITWNLFLTPIVTTVSTGLILFFIKNLFKQRDKKDEQIAELLSEKECAKQKDFDDFHSKTNKSFEYINNSLDEKVSMNNYTERKNTIDNKLDLLEKTLDDVKTADIGNNFAHTTLGVSLSNLEKTIDEHETNAVNVREILFDKLSAIDVTLKLINGSVRDTKQGLAVHIAEGHK